MSLILGIDPIDGEAWMPIEGFDGYRVSNMGRIVSIRRKTPVLMRATLDKDGYSRIQLRRAGKHIHAVLSRVVCAAFNGPPERLDHVCCHRDNNKQNNRASNLRWGTQLSNIADKLTHGTHQVGDSHPRSIITAEIARAVKRELRLFPGTRGKLLHASRVTGAPYAVVADISSGKSWRDV